MRYHVGDHMMPPHRAGSGRHRLLIHPLLSPPLHTLSATYPNAAIFHTVVTFTTVCWRFSSPPRSLKKVQIAEDAAATPVAGHRAPNTATAFAPAPPDSGLVPTPPSILATSARIARCGRATAPPHSGSAEAAPFICPPGGCRRRVGCRGLDTRGAQPPAL